MLELAKLLRLRRKVVLLRATGNIPPMAFGVIKPAIILPASSTKNLPDDELDAVISHELAHHLRGDLWANLLLAVLGALWWFNPILWIVNRRFREACENCCDDMLIAREITTDHTYCSALLKIASSLPDTLQLNAAFGFAARIHPLAVRMGRIMDTRTKKLTRLPITSVGLILVIAGLALPGLPGHTPKPAEKQLISEVLPPQAETPIAADNTQAEISARNSKNSYALETLENSPATGASSNIIVPLPASKQLTSAAVQPLTALPAVSQGTETTKYQENRQAVNFVPQQFSMNHAPQSSSISPAAIPVRQISLQSSMMISPPNTSVTGINQQRRPVSVSTTNGSRYQPSQRYRPALNSQQAESGMFGRSMFATTDAMSIPTQPKNESGPKKSSADSMQKTIFIGDAPIESHPGKPLAETPSMMTGPSIPEVKTQPYAPSSPPSGDTGNSPENHEPDWMLQDIYRLFDGGTLQGADFVHTNGISSVDNNWVCAIPADLGAPVLGDIELETNSMDDMIIPWLDENLYDILPPWYIESMYNHLSGQFNPSVSFVPDPTGILPLGVGGLILLRKRKRNA